MKQIVFLLITVSLALAAKDASVEEKATGKEVVEAVVRKITRSNIFQDDHSFLIRLAYVESHFGADNHTFTGNFTGGLWQVDEVFYNQTKSNNLTPLHTKIHEQFNINWTSTSWRDLLKPLHSGLAASLYFNSTLREYSDTVEGQANDWLKWYREGGDLKKFLNASEELRNQSTCRGKMDLVIVLDGSGSIKESPFQIAKNFVADMIKSFSLDFTQIGMLVYSDYNTVIFEVNNTLSLTQLAEKAKNARYPEGATYTAAAILEGVDMFKRSRPANESSKGVPKIMTIFTDGESNDRIELEGAVLKAANASIKTVAIGIGSGIYYPELLTIARNDINSVFTVAGFGSLNDFLLRITTVACETPQEPELDEPLQDSLEQNEKRIYKMALPSTGITINVQVTSGKTAGYWSRTEPVPSAAVNDGEINGITFIPGTGTLAVNESSVYFTIQGLEKNNTYTVTSEQGNKVPTSTTTEKSGSGVVMPLVSILVILVSIAFL